MLRQQFVGASQTEGLQKHPGGQGGSGGQSVSIKQVEPPGMEQTGPLAACAAKGAIKVVAAGTIAIGKA